MIRVVILLLAIAAAWWPRAAAAYHAGAVFADAGDKGGAGGIFYTGAPLERGWRCTMCHEGAVGKVSLRAEVDPPDLLETGSYEVGASYRFTVRMLGEHVEVGAGRNNYNGIVVTTTNADGIYSGEFRADSVQFFTGGNGSALASSVPTSVTSWDFTWDAPTEVGQGAVILWFGGVDGNGGPEGGDLTLGDPFLDDVIMASITLEERGATTAIAPTTDPQSDLWRVSFGPGAPMSDEKTAAGRFFATTTPWSPSSHAARLARAPAALAAQPIDFSWSALWLAFGALLGVTPTRFLQRSRGVHP